MFCLLQNSGIEKAFLFDVVSKIYIATDSMPVDMQTYELCCDMIDVVIDISCIYGLVLGWPCYKNNAKRKVYNYFLISVGLHIRLPISSKINNNFCLPIMCTLYILHNRTCKRLISKIITFRLRKIFCFVLSKYQLRCHCVHSNQICILKAKTFQRIYAN